MSDGFLPATYYVSKHGNLHAIDGAVIEEALVCLYVNGRELVSFMCTPLELEALALGFLRSEGLIDSLDDVEILSLSPAGRCVDIWLRTEVPIRRKPILTSGCGGGKTFDDLEGASTSLPDGPQVSTSAVIERYFEMRAVERLYPAARGVHTAGLCTPDRLLLIGEDVGRHNTVDKIWGKAMRQAIDPQGGMLLTTGRISSEMLGKAAKMGVPIVASRTSPTSRSLALAEAWNMTVIGYIRRGGLRVYTGIKRIVEH